jgi:PAS domain S-box-containing protein
VKRDKVLRITAIVLVGAGAAGPLLLLLDLPPAAGLFERHPLGMAVLFLVLTTAGPALDLAARRYRRGEWAARWALLAAVVSPLAAVVVLGFAQTRRGLTEAAFSQRVSLARLAAVTLKERFDRMADLGVSIATRVRFREQVAAGRWDEARRVLTGVPGDFPFIDRVFLADVQGTLKADVPEAPGVKNRNFAFRDWYRGVMEKRGPYVSELYQRAAPPRIPVVAVATPVNDLRQEAAGILVLQIAAETLFRWGRDVQVGPEGYAYFVDRQGHAIGLPGSGAGDPLTDHRGVPLVQRLLRGEGGVEMRFDPAAGEEVLSAYESVPDYGWGVVVRQPARAVFAARHDVLRRLAAVYGFILLLGSLCAYAVLRALVVRRQVERERERFFTLALDLLCIAGFDGYFKRLSPVWERTLGFTLGELLERPFIEFVHPDDREATGREAARLAQGLDVVSFENRYRCRDGAYRWLLWSATADTGEGLIYATARDITDRRKADEEIRRLNENLRDHARQLEAANKELEAFSYSVSHDLRAPLRGIDGFSQALLEECGDRLDARGKGYLERVRGAAQRMGQLIEDMLALSRVTRTEMRREPVDVSALAEAVARELESGAPQRQVEFVIGTGLSATGDARLLRVVLQNLLGNAWKFTSRRARARIEFGTAPGPDGKPAFFVRDNGAGFDMAYAHKLFGAFQRLHGVTEFEGTGVGLATVQRIVRRHGGEAWAEGRVGGGATFYFTL